MRGGEGVDPTLRAALRQLSGHSRAAEQGWISPLVGQAVLQAGLDVNGWRLNRINRLLAKHGYIEFRSRSFGDSGVPDFRLTRDGYAAIGAGLPSWRKPPG
jgi:hypothetical protein